jgi:SAM-dependent methyltransferase
MRLDEMVRRLPLNRHGAVDSADTPTESETGVARLADIDALATEWQQRPKRNARINGHLRRMLAQADLTSGRVLEIGAREHPRTEFFPAPEWQYAVLDIEAVGLIPDGLEVVIGDITNCPEIPDESYDVIVSVDVFEHVDRPWKAAAEISRLLKPGGLSYTSTLFSWRYHPVPIDYWRFTPPCLAFLFDQLDTTFCDFDTTERRRDVRGRGKRDRVPIDALGGWRENWRVCHVGTKPA